MSEHYYSSHDVQHVAELIKQHSLLYEQLFEKLAREMYSQLTQVRETQSSMNNAITYCYQLAELAQQDFQLYFPNRDTLACQQGCHHCCSLPVEVPIQVVQHIADFLQQQLSAESLQQLQTKLTDYSQEPATIEKKRLCPFLTADNACSIYSHRPPACRAFTSPDVGLCLRSVQTGSQVPQSPVTLRIYEAMTSAFLADAQTHLNQPNARQVTFIPALNQALSQCE